VRSLTRWYWIRHAPAIDHEGRLYGQRDVDCDCSDATAMAALARALPTDAVWVTTPLKRTRETAEAIRKAAEGPPLGAEPIVEPLLMEQNFGAWQGQKRSEVIKHRTWIAAAEEVPPGGENFVSVTMRVRRAIESMNQEYRGRDIVAVAHGGTIRSALGVALDLTPELALAFAVDNLSLTVLERFSETGRSHDWRVVTVNRPPR
jgi:alpha-ribazole phosphatase